MGEASVRDSWRCAKWDSLSAEHAKAMLARWTEYAFGQRNMDVFARTPLDTGNRC
jgi:hypothetical protein